MESRAGDGATFRFTVVFEKQFPDGATDAEPAATLRGSRVLIVDDNATNRHLLTVLLGSWGCEHKQAADPHTALMMLRDASEAGKPFEIAILDFQMPDMDGEELGWRIKQDPAIDRTMLVMLSSIGRRGDAERFKQVGFSAYLAKPVKQAQLFQCLASLLGHTSHGDFAVPGNPGAATRHTLTESQRMRIRVLVVEDNPTNQKVALSILGNLGYQADAVSNGLEAVQVLGRTSYDLVLMDCLMPEMDGYEAARVIRDPESPVLDHSIPIVAMTACAVRGDAEKCIEAGMNAYLGKPVDPWQLAAAIERMLACEIEVTIPPEHCSEDTRLKVFDRADLHRRLMGNEALMRTVIEGFLEDIPTQIESLAEAIGMALRERSNRHAHSIKGAAANVGGLALRDKALAMEELCLAGEFRRAEELLPGLKECFEDFERSVARFLKREQRESA